MAPRDQPRPRFVTALSSDHQAITGGKHGLARRRPDKSLARFERIALVLSGGGALGAYQAGAYAALEKCGVRPNWIAGTAIGAINAAIIAGNPPHERALQLRQFWREVSKHQQGRRRQNAGWSARSVLTNWLTIGRRRIGTPSLYDNPVISSAALRTMIEEVVDFDRMNSGGVRVVLGAV